MNPTPTNKDSGSGEEMAHIMFTLNENFYAYQDNRWDYKGPTPIDIALAAIRAYTQRQSLQAELKILHELPKTGLTDAVGLYAYQVSKVEYDALVSTLTQQLKDLEEGKKK